MPEVFEGRVWKGPMERGLGTGDVGTVVAGISANGDEVADGQAGQVGKNYTLRNLKALWSDRRRH